MVGMPYLLLGGFGFMIFRSVKAAQQNQSNPPAEPPESR
jgi:hypothetical protein